MIEINKKVKITGGVEIESFRVNIQTLFRNNEVIAQLKYYALDDSQPVDAYIEEEKEILDVETNKMVMANVRTVMPKNIFIDNKDLEGVAFQDLNAKIEEIVLNKL